MGAACYCEYDGFWDRFEAKRPIARGEYRCTECGCDIHAGERYERASGHAEGCWFRYKTCHRCLALRDWLEAASCCFCWSYEGLMEEAPYEITENNWKPGYKFAALRLLADIKREQRGRRK